MPPGNTSQCDSPFHLLQSMSLFERGSQAMIDFRSFRFGLMCVMPGFFAQPLRAVMQR